jgi:hypothetical protein
VILAAIRVAKTGESGGQGLAQTENPLEARKGDLDVLPQPDSPLLRPLAHQRNPQLGQLLLQRLAPVSKIPKVGITPRWRTNFAYATATSSIVACSYSEGLK